MLDANVIYSTLSFSFSTSFSRDFQGLFKLFYARKRLISLLRNNSIALYQKARFLAEAVQCLFKLKCHYAKFSQK